MWKKTYDVPDSLVEEKRQRVKQRTISIAFPLSGQNHTTSVFAYLPTSMKRFVLSKLIAQSHSGFPFLINADFILVLSRQEMVSPSECVWNQWILNLIAPTFVDAIMKYLHQSGDLRYEAYRYIPMKESHTSCFEGIRRSILSSLGGLPTVITLDGTLACGHNCYMVPEELQKVC